MLDSPSQERAPAAKTRRARLLRLSDTMIALLCVLALLDGVLSIPLQNDDAVTTVWTFSNNTWIENLAIRDSGDILCSSLNRAALYLVNPFEHTATTVHQFDNTDGVLGIAEVWNDVFVVVTCDVDVATSLAIAGSAKAWEVDMSAWELEEASAVTLIANLTSVGIPDGVLTLPSVSGVVLIADAGNGIIWRLDTCSGEYGIAIQDPLFRTTNTLVPLGVDGIHLLNNNELYFTSIGDSFLGRVMIDELGTALDLATVIANMTLPDDFAFGANGTAYLVGANTPYQALPGGEVIVLAGGANDAVQEGATSAAFGKTIEDRDMLYISTNGGMLAPVSGRIVGGQIAAVNVRLFS
ncbi:hypothetical protein BAUCODRAFT_147540 [Baudoinia panamericana UAMH 10762]|uniref:SMP-30/Gluconolactonase/LRE-like region domain-containing protein n=1 Tax=Baudoinia panamericana (strain UAMH 10762) TaxID=717646 RepID=M2MLB5_BAUPA|nr:uncharacterized protein BAUCODRAFT_147540 [Baudoinia panamericana UAMH 10762]EMC97461.1 hypothetical protein BAUCODRAFT_147540 [Baudoinia panamericana UAMH 10762]